MKKRKLINLTGIALICLSIIIDFIYALINENVPYLSKVTFALGILIILIYESLRGHLKMLKAYQNEIKSDNFKEINYYLLTPKNKIMRVSLILIIGALLGTLLKSISDNRVLMILYFLLLIIPGTIEIIHNYREMKPRRHRR